MNTGISSSALRSVLSMIVADTLFWRHLATSEIRTALHLEPGLMFPAQDGGL